MASSVTSPSPRVWPFTASTRDTGYLWGGNGDTEPEAVFIYSVNTETWTRKLTKGLHPPAVLCDGGCSIAGQHIYIYGGRDGSSCSGSLYQLNTDTLTWRKLSNCSAGGPGKKSGCRMITYQDQLLVVGGLYGYNVIPETRQPRARYEDGRTNEVHCYSLSTGTWSSPSVKGSRPPPCSHHCLTVIDEKQAVMFGGVIPGGYSSDVHILHLPTTTWRQISREPNTPWPKGRSNHIAVCLGYGEENKSLLVSGGWSDGLVTLNDIWLLDIQSRVWAEVKKDKNVQRYGHCATSFSLSSECTEVLLFGGESDSQCSRTAVLRFEFQESGRFQKRMKWCLTSIADDTILGSLKRLAEERKIMETFTMQQGIDNKEVRKLRQQLEKCQVTAQAEEELQRQAAQPRGQAEELQVPYSDKEADLFERSVTKSETRIEELYRQVRRAEESDRRAEESDRRAEESDRRAEESDRRAEESDRRAEESDRRAEESDRRAEESDRRAEELQRQVAQSDRRAEESDKRAEESDRRAEESDRRAEESDRRAEESDRRAEESRGRTENLEKSLAEMRQTLRDYEDRLLAYDTQWAVRREEIELTGPELGRGAWASVTVAKFRGAQVAVKRIHNLLVSRHNVQLFRREITMASRLRHPNLVQFIGATVEGDMMIVMEFMTTSLRSQLQRDEYFQPSIVKSISLDVAMALNYLHQIQPDPIVHRDISSANVLLEQLTPPKLWKAKVTDCGTVNLVRQLNTESPGGPAYAAPEAIIPCLQSPKMDIYSFGALVLEMLTGRLPAPDDRAGLLCQVHHEQLLGLIRRCLSKNTADRPTANEVISLLS